MTDVIDATVPTDDETLNNLPAAIRAVRTLLNSLGYKNGETIEVNLTTPAPTVVTGLDIFKLIAPYAQNVEEILGASDFDVCILYAGTNNITLKNYTTALTSPSYPLKLKGNPADPDITLNTGDMMMFIFVDNYWHEFWRALG